MPVQVGPRIRISDLIERGRKSKVRAAVFDPSALYSYGVAANQISLQPNQSRPLDITDYNDDEFMLSSEIEAAARRLKIILP